MSDVYVGYTVTFCKYQTIQLSISPALYYNFVTQIHWHILGNYAYRFTYYPHVKACVHCADTANLITNYIVSYLGKTNPLSRRVTL